ncbi:glycosyltransferase family 61 protein [uncultured Paracoccus sp.]|uniref:glycosyltransferase family 61 protein n=1 Tax=uncultured Paracoccus sp. TaxID=189685 RepID=UPI002607A1F0|nr:glycosyltransferase family 61 protein [uncultured Paracoccus sp.]
MRHLENEAELADELARRGFEIVDPMQETAKDLVQRLSGSALAVSVEGSALTHAYLTR